MLCTEIHKPAKREKFTQYRNHSTNKVVVTKNVRTTLRFKPVEIIIIFIDYKTDDLTLKFSTQFYDYYFGKKCSWLDTVLKKDILSGIKTHRNRGRRMKVTQNRQN